MTEKISNILASLASDGHIVCGMIIFLVGAAIYTWHGLDGTFVTFTTTILAFLGGHFYTATKYAGNGNGNGHETEIVASPPLAGQ